MAANVLLLAGAIVAAWAVLSVIGGERQRRVNELEAERRSPPASPEKVPAEAPRQAPGPLKTAG